MAHPLALGGALIALAVAVGCGDDGTAGSASTTTTHAEQAEADKPQDKPSGVEIVATCADTTGQDIYAKPPGKPAFMDCLERLDAPQDVIDAWK